jgi:hypothetical protein
MDIQRISHDEQERLVALRTAVAIGKAQLERDERLPYTADSLAIIKRNARKKMREGRKPKPDVIP